MGLLSSFTVTLDLIYQNTTSFYDPFLVFEKVQFEIPVFSPIYSFLSIPEDYRYSSRTLERVE